MRVAIIADDLTGALTPPSPSRCAGCGVSAQRTPGELATALDRAAEVVAVSTGSRDLDAAEALARVDAVRAGLEARRAAGRRSGSRRSTAG